MKSAPPHRIAIVLLAAIADNGVIGRGNALPFRQGSLPLRPMTPFSAAATTKAMRTFPLTPPPRP